MRPDAERGDWWRIGWRMLFAGLLAAGLTTGIIGLVNQGSSTATVVNAIANGNTAGHKDIARLLRAIENYQRSVNQGGATVSRILTEAGQVAKQLEMGQTVSSTEIASILFDVTALCRSNPVCAAQTG